MDFLGGVARLVLLASIVFAVVVAAYLIPFLYSIRPRRPKETGFRYVYVNDDGSARDLTDDEQEYLNTDFEGGDGNRPYIKSNYSSKTPDGNIGGYLWRRHLPKRIEIRPAPNEDSLPESIRVHP